MSSLVLSALMVGLLQVRNEPAVPAQVIFQADFEGVAAGSVPAGFTPVHGEFVVREHDNNKFLESPRAPVDEYTMTFGPSEAGNLSLVARVLGTAKGKRYPVFGIGLGGASGYRLQVSPGKRVIELCKGDDRKATAPFEWIPGKWLWLKLEVTKVTEVKWRARCKAWYDAEAEPVSWGLVVEEESPIRTGRAMLIAAPISGTPIRFDNLRIERVVP
ncbi:MAG: hypothetical protein N3G20_08680 [Verrucomicrobiae bacterium]|nr:hypothetical protein [Verrucomicrobiae bacterium]